MAAGISRRKLAAYVADKLIDSDKSVLRELAAYLIDTGRQREVSLVARDIEMALLKKGTAVATTTSARALSKEARETLEIFIKQTYQGVTTVHLRETIDESVIGGVKLELPDAELNATVAKKLEKLTV